MLNFDLCVFEYMLIWIMNVDFNLKGRVILGEGCSVNDIFSIVQHRTQLSNVRSKNLKTLAMSQIDTRRIIVTTKWR